ncbi:phosphoribosyl-ATP pyrophosphohydrolase [Candidatus Gracilibacteria bacterium]|nr:MAG: phosphoribosyl-ATP pyrophosphohydrolase [Candidatus Gracilibacteria bacterium]
MGKFPRKILYKNEVKKLGGTVQNKDPKTCKNCKFWGFFNFRRMKTTYNKLVRDKIPEVLDKKGIKFETRVLSKKEKLEFLLEKLKEEVGELLEAKMREERVGEFADIFEVLYALAEENNISLTEIEQMRIHKKQERGGFEEGIFLISTEE